MTAIAAQPFRLAGPDGADTRRRGPGRWPGLRGWGFEEWYGAGPADRPGSATMLRLQRGSGYEQAEAQLCLVEAGEFAVTLGPPA